MKITKENLCAGSERERPPKTLSHAPDESSHDMIYDSDLLDGLKERPFKSVPCKFLYDDMGSVLFEKITNLKEYYPYRAERMILETQGHLIANSIPSHAVLVELGPGDCSKTICLLKHLVAKHGTVRYIGVDVSSEALRQAHESLRRHCGSISDDNITMIEAEYLEGLSKAQECAGQGTPLCVLWLGSSVGNYTREESVDIFTSMWEVLNENAMILLGTDLWKDEKVLMNAYNDSQGITRDFIINGMMHVLKTCNHSLQYESPERLWTYDPRINRELTQVEMWVEAKQKIPDILPGIDVKKGERLLVEISRKFTMDDVSALATKSHVVIHSMWKSSQFSIQLLGSVRRAFETCWQDSDALFDHIQDWTAKPIDLRHPFVFYYGHVASFTKMKLDETENHSGMDVLLSRGIDPHVESPDVCHDHPAVPESWPTKTEMIHYVRETRLEILKILETYRDMKTIHLCLEHERMHQETLCYMLAQLRKQAMPDVLATDTTCSGFYFQHASYMNSFHGAGDTKCVCVPNKVISLGVERSKMVDFRWDNEYGEYDPIEVQSFNVASMPVTVRAYSEFILDGGYKNQDLWSSEDFDLNQKHKVTLPATWSLHDQTFMIHMPEQSYTFDEVADQPVYVSLAEALAFATWKKKSIMTEGQYEAALEEFGGNDTLTQGGWEWTSSHFLPLKGFEPNAAYPEYSTDFFDRRHFTLKGSSPYTHPCLKRASFRNFYQKNYRYVFAKFRLVDDCTVQVS